MDTIEQKQAQVRRAVCEVIGGAGIASLVVGQVMTCEPRCVETTASMLEIVRLFHAKNFRHVLVVDAAGLLRGVISDRDVSPYFGPDHRLEKSELLAITAEQVMSTDLLTIRASAPLVDAVSLMIEQGISSLPVLADQRLVGIITDTDMHIMLQALLTTNLAIANRPRAATHAG